MLKLKVSRDVRLVGTSPGTPGAFSSCPWEETLASRSSQWFPPTAGEVEVMSSGLAVLL